jgi:hypothetical protein
VLSAVHWQNIKRNMLWNMPRVAILCSGVVCRCLGGGEVIDAAVQDDG